MRIILAAAFTSIALFSANALAVTVDFESDINVVDYDVPEEWGFGPGLPTLPVRIDSKGFSFGFQGTEGEWGGESLLSPPGATLPSDYFGGLFILGPGSEALPYRIWASDNSLFNAQSLDVFVGYIDPSCEGTVGCGTMGNVTIKGFQTGDDSWDPSLSISIPANSTTAGWFTVNLDASWSNLEYIQIDTQTYNPVFGLNTYTAVELDNFTATVVPVPAAIWLFLSGLSVLGLRRRFG